MTARRVIKPKVSGFICVTAHPYGCFENVRSQIAYVREQGLIRAGAKNVLVIGASTGYGLASRIVAAFGCGANTVGVFFERPSDGRKPASAGWYNAAAFESEAQSAGLYAKSINGDAFSHEIMDATVDLIKADLGEVDLVIFSLASPRRQHPDSGRIHTSTLKPIGESFTAKTVDTDKGVIKEITLQPASPQEIDDTIAVMGGEPWRLWIDKLFAKGVVAPKMNAVAYSYIGPQLTWPIYRDGSIGKAKADLERTTKLIDEQLRSIGGRGYVSINQAVVTQASSAIPVVPLYLSLLLKVLREKNVLEDCIEQMHRLFSDHLYNGNEPVLDHSGRIRLDDLELRPDVQEAVRQSWTKVTTENLIDVSDFQIYREKFLNLFGFELTKVDYEVPVDPVRLMAV